MTQHDPNGLVPPPVVNYPPGAYGFPQQAGYRPPPSGGNGLSIAALVLGAVGLVIGWIPFVGLLGAGLAAVGLILGIIAIVLARSTPQRSTTIPLIGVILSMITIVVSIYMTTYAAKKIGEVADDFKKKMEQMEAERAAAAAEAAKQKAQAEKEEQAARDALGLLPFRIIEDGHDFVAMSNPKNHWMTIVASGDLTADSVRAILKYLRTKTHADTFRVKVLAEDARAPGQTFKLYDNVVDWSGVPQRIDPEQLVAYRKAVGLPPATQPATQPVSNAR